MAYYIPTNCEEAYEFLSAKDCKIIAGCTDFFPNLKLGKHPENLLDVSRIETLRGVSQHPDGWRIGAATTWADVSTTALPPAFDGLKLAAREVGSVQIQNVATVVGNICNASSAADGVPPLLALDAVIEIGSKRGQRSILLDEFVTGSRTIELAADELVTAIMIPNLDREMQSNFFKLGSRTYLVISIVMVAIAIVIRGKTITDLRVAVGSCSPTSVRLPTLENFLTGQSLDAIKAITFPHDLFEPLSPISDIRASKEYRLTVVPELCRRLILGSIARSPI
ncbi:MAG: xanthine dehydrogenase family protein subunit M [Aestuariivita sp.]|nr:xanthine dehydrogenase family protein subunit M [Aestuariivita sp.]MCY4202613.1 xanthine dehydrogenase family protein subunit M [Aestuariivita sp.]